MKKIVILLSMLLLSSCISGGLSMSQKRELREVKDLHPDIYQEDTKVDTAVALGFLFGGGSFYTGHPVSGVFNLLFWPLSIFWDPFNGYEGALEQNYYATKAKYNKLKAEGKTTANLF